jgi:hypothetical protein
MNPNKTSGHTVCDVHILITYDDLPYKMRPVMFTQRRIMYCSSKMAIFFPSQFPANPVLRHNDSEKMLHDKPMHSFLLLQL